MGRKGIETLVGVFVLLGMIAVVFLALKAANLASFNVGSTYALTAKFDNIGGLKVRAPVKSAGVVVGRVGKISFDTQDYEAEVELDIDSAYKFPVDTSASIMTSGLLGEQYIGLEAGAEDKMLTQGSALKITQGAIVLENLISQFLYGKASEGNQSSQPTQ